MNKTRNTSKAPLAEFVRPRWVCAKGIDIFKMVGKKSERGLQNMGLMETVEIREERADSHRSHKPGENARRGKLKEEGVSSGRHISRARMARLGKNHPCLLVIPFPIVPYKRS